VQIRKSTSCTVSIHAGFYFCLANVTYYMLLKYAVKTRLFSYLQYFGLALVGGLA